MILSVDRCSPSRGSHSLPRAAAIDAKIKVLGRTAGLALLADTIPFGIVTE
jgi:hypothetical protein